MNIDEMVGVAASILRLGGVDIRASCQAREASSSRQGVCRTG